MKKALQWILPLLLLIAGSGACFAQSMNSGDIRGTVTDATGAVVPGAKVTVINVETGVSKEFITNQEGVYDTSSILPGNYTVTFAKDGFETLTRGPITLVVGFTAVNGQLKVGSATVEVTVNTDVPLLSTETGDQTSTLQSHTLQELPQIGESWESFMILLPGTSGCQGNNCNQGASNPGQSIASNGNLPYSNVLADGASTTLSHSQNANPAIMETVDELQVSLSSFSAQYGVGGMIINQITKGGTAQFHGSFYDYLQNSFFNSRAYNRSAPDFKRYHDFGGTVGGPILKKKMFFFFDYDQIIDHHPASTSLQTVPTEAIMSGDFSTETRTIYDPFTQVIAHDAAGNPYPVRKSFAEEYGNGNKLPSAMIDSVANAFQKIAYPTSSNHIPSGKFLPGSTNSLGLLQNNWQSAVPQSTPYRKFFGRLDYDITPNNRLSMSDTQSDTPVIYPSSIAACPVNCQSGDVDNNNAQITDVWNVSSNLINEARFGYTVQLNFYADLTLGKGIASKLGWQFGKADTIPNIQFTGNYPYAWVSPQTNSVYKEHVFDPSDVVTLIHGKHILHFGGELLMYQDNSTAWGNTNAGTFQYSGQYTQQWKLNDKGIAAPDTGGSGVEYADLLLGLSWQWTAGVTPEYAARLKSPQMFVQDDWKVRPNLTLNLGFRYQINHGWNETHGNIDSFDPTIINPATNSLGAFWFANTHVNGRGSLQQNVFSTFLPRLGFSWAPKADTTVRGGIGLYSYNWSLDNYGNGMGHPFGSVGGLSDQTNGITPIAQLDGKGNIMENLPAGGIGEGSTPLPFSANSSTPDRFNGQDVNFNLYNTPVPKIVQYNFALQRQLGNQYMAELAYVGSHGMYLPVSTDLNAIPANKLSANDVALGFRPYSNFGGISGRIYEGISNYNSLQASITKRMSKGLNFAANYVWSHFLDDMDSAGWGSHMGPTDYQVANNPTANYGNSNFDARHAVKGRAVYELPFGRGKMFLNQNPLLDAVAGGWQLSSTVVLQSGSPFEVNFNDNSSGASWQHAGTAYPNWVPGASWKAANQNAKTWINPAAFQYPGDGRFGNVKRNSLYGPGWSSVNLSAGKKFTLPWEGVQLSLRGDAQNVFNHTSLASPGNITVSGRDSNGVFQSTTNATAISDGAITGRNLQFVLKATF